jgi:hypothetical protein
LRKLPEVGFKRSGEKNATRYKVVLLAISAVFIGLYLLETWRIRKTAERQVEASFRPAVIVTHDGSTTHLPQLENIGNGPAMELAWTLQNSKLKHAFPYLRPNAKEWLFDVQELYNAGGGSGRAVIECSYRSLSGHHYSSMSTCDLNTIQFTTTFRDS